MFSTWLIASIEFRGLFSAFVWGPLELLLVSYFIEQAKAGGKMGIWENLLSIVLLGLVMTMQYLPGYPQMLLYTQLLIGLYILARCSWLRTLPTLINTVKFCAAGGVVAAGLSMAQFLPSMEFVKLSERGQQIDPGLNQASLQLPHLLTLVFPFLFGRAGYPHEYWGHTVYEFWIGTCYVGIVPLMLIAFAPLCLGKAFRDSRKPYIFLFLFFVALAVFGLLMSMGKYTPLYMWFSSSVPGFNHFRWPSKFLVFVLYSLSILAGLGYQVLLDAKTVPEAKRPIRITFIICLFFVATVTVAWLMAENGRSLFDQLTGGTFFFTPEHYLQMRSDFREASIFSLSGFAILAAIFSNRIRPALSGSILIVIAFLNLWIISRQIHPILDGKIFEYEATTVRAKVPRMDYYQVHSMYADIGQFLYGNHDPEAWQWAREAGTNSTLQPLGIFHTFQDGLKLQRHLELFQILGQLPPNEQNRLADLLGIRFLITGESPEKMLWGGLPRRVDVIERPGALPKAHLADHWYVVKGLADAARHMVDPTFDPLRDAVIEPGNLAFPSEADRPSSSEESGTHEVRSIQYTWNTVALKVAANHRSLLVLNDTWYPGWKVMVDGNLQPIILTNMNFRGVFLEKGDHTVLFTYDPWQFRVGLAISLATLATVLLLLTLRYRNAFQRQGETKS